MTTYVNEMSLNHLILRLIINALQTRYLSKPVPVYNPYTRLISPQEHDTTEREINILK